MSHFILFSQNKASLSRSRISFGNSMNNSEGILRRRDLFNSTSWSYNKEHPIIWSTPSFQNKSCKFSLQYETLKTRVGHTWHPMVPSEAVSLWSHGTILGPRRAVRFHRGPSVAHTSFHCLVLYFILKIHQRIYRTNQVHLLYSTSIVHVLWNVLWL